MAAQEWQSIQYNRHKNTAPDLRVGDKVFLSTANLVTDEGSKKLSDLRTGPFPILKKVSESAYKIKLPPHMKVNPTFHVSRLTLAKNDPIKGRVPSEPNPVIVDGEEQYEVERIIDSNWLGKHFQYKVSYMGYGKEHNEWQFRDDLLEDLGKEEMEEMENEFYRRHPRAKRYTDSFKERRPPIRGMTKK